MLSHKYRQLTGGTQYWKDDYLLEKRVRSKRPVVYHGQDLNGYKLLRRLGDWCWLVRNTHKSIYFPSSSLTMHKADHYD
jgi:hypothetical protein